MFKDAFGETRYEFWEGIRMDGKIFKSEPLYHVCMDYGNAMVEAACRHLGCYPYVADLSAIKDECKRQEGSYV